MSRSSRWTALGLGEPVRLGLPENPTAGDLAVYALRLARTDDPIEGIVLQVAAELAHLGDLFCEGDQGEMYLGFARRLEVAMSLLRRADGREEKPTMPAPAPAGDDDADERPPWEDKPAAPPRKR